MKKRLFSLVCCVTMLCSGCSSAINPSSTSGISASTSPVVTATPAPTTKTGKVLALGSKTSIGEWEIKVKKAEVKSDIDNGMYVFEPSKGSKYVCITATVRNNGKKEGTFIPTVGYANKDIFATLYYQDKYEYKCVDLINYKKDLCDLKIQPLTSKTGIIAFDVPKKVAKKKGNLTLKIGTDTDFATYSLQ